MRQIVYFLFLLLMISCGPPTEQSSKENKESVTNSTLMSVDTLDTKQHIVFDAEQVRQKPEVITNDSSDLYVDRVYYFGSTQEPYVSLRFKAGYNYDSIKSIETLLDSIIIDDGEIRRTRVHRSIAEQYFDLSMLDSIAIFNYSHRQVATGYLERIEYFEDLLGNQFIAVFKSDNQRYYYCA